MRAHTRAMLQPVLLTLGFGRLGSKSSHNLTSTFETCHTKLGNTLGEPWMSCVVDTLLAKQDAAQEAGSSEFFPIAAHSYDPFRQLDGGSYFSESDNLKNKMRDYSCDVADGGSQPLRTTSWEYETPDPCSAGGAVRPGPFIYKSNRFLPAGNDIPELGGGQMSVEKAEAACAAEPRCQGFTFSAAGWSDSPMGRQQKHTISFKSEGDDSANGEGWHTFKRRKAPLDCGRGGGDSDKRGAREMRNLRVQVLRESPPVYIVDDFLTSAECDYMLNYTLPRMGPSVVIGGSTSSWRQARVTQTYMCRLDRGTTLSNAADELRVAVRQSFSVNMYPDYDDESHVITRVARRKFAFARDFVGYSDVHENEGQV